MRKAGPKKVITPLGPAPCKVRAYGTGLSWQPINLLQWHSTIGYEYISIIIDVFQCITSHRRRAAGR